MTRPCPKSALTRAAVLVVSAAVALPAYTQQAEPTVSQMHAFQQARQEQLPQASTLPPTPPTTQTTPAAPLAATPNGPPMTTTKPHHAQVTYADGLIDVRANDSSLNQILRSISRQTGMTITGGVQDQRVFGNYGPASPSEILATLLDGTGTNILLTEGNASTPPTLTLTPRGGGPTPPSPASSTEGDAEDDQPQRPAEFRQQQPPQPQRLPAQAAQPATSNPAQLPQPLPELSGPQPVPPPQNNVLGSPQNSTPTASQIPTTNSVPLDAVPTPSTTTAGTGGQGIVDSANPPPADSTTGSAATAQSIYQQLLQLQQKKQQQTPAPAPAANPQ
jgi:hypothetical protein